MHICASGDVGDFIVGCADLSLCSGGSVLPANRDTQLFVFLENLWPSAVAEIAYLALVAWAIEACTSRTGCHCFDS